MSDRRFSVLPASSQRIEFSREFDGQLADQSVDLGTEFELKRIELTADEFGILLIIPTLTKLNSNPVKSSSSSSSSSAGETIGTSTIRRLTIMRFELRNAWQADARLELQYLVNRKLDWRMIGQLFAIQGVLYGVKDRHSYQSKLLFAFDLIRCKFLSSEYVNGEPGRLFTNHFTNTQMISYQPNEPPRLQILDSGNLLECPVKLMQSDLIGNNTTDVT